MQPSIGKVSCFEVLCPRLLFPAPSHNGNVGRSASGKNTSNDL